ncbi:uncharacterized protein LOC124454591 [Xenia sp. Carnegie-2017]|uniref:uncharacterized protein LOC124454591 n=1 Tax=Xenia sp. Carnegie-2017 TaxID=2897299 RepID=UPI001F0383D5|nr:uncharacterized protein LOC124454591 [Xenia sp. Carnegie-2017]XP_046861321.1 uncharacterized protein LOC124454591 [Xenia sp. Carnegie-2017]XP_046861322.1 uncharacterized protein LOC124454591 [Xenia sp. Carnegie-2017]
MSGLTVVTAPALTRVYTDVDTGADMDLSVFQAALFQIPYGFFIIGQAAVGHTSAKNPATSSIILVKPSKPEMVAEPVHFEEVWNDKGTGGSEHCSFWRVVPPKDYVALGDLVTKGYDPPTSALRSKYACIKKEFVVQGVMDPSPIWKDKGSGADGDGSLWQVHGEGLGGFFKVQSGYSMPSFVVYVLPATVEEKRKS